MIQFRIKQVFAFILTVVAAFSISISLTIISSPLSYKLTIPLFGLTDKSGLSGDQLMENFQVIVNYLLNPTVSSLEMPYFPASEGGIVHFEEVKVLIQMNLILSLVGLGAIFLIIWWIRKQRIMTYFIQWFQIAVYFPLFLIFLIIVSFDQVFLLFHKILFNNDLWLFNPMTDPVINVLPQELFMIYFFIAILIYEVIILISRKISFR
ncbi:TIGR01906 family membrane protein [Fundicoccus sp. Sow4_H7]|uniref:TIGR01906 family membrane protein n=1 Tax=Fundicoccus sp. Sow4_H7 TaxID=3438784 RepID=UPI003F8EB143